MKSETQMVELRKYPNRRYYDATHSRHVTLEEIQTMVRDGCEVRVTDSASGDDITAKVLTQIILDLDSPKLSIFPVPLLHRLIRANEALARDFVDKYFNQALVSFLDSQRQFEQYLRQSMLLPTAPPAMADWTRFMLSPFGAPPAGAGGAGGAGGEAARDQAGTGDPRLMAEMDALKQQLAALQKALGQGAPPRKTPRAKKASRVPGGGE